MMAFMIIKGNIICWHFLKALPSVNNFHCILRAITANFWDKVFSLRIWGHFIQQCRATQFLPKPTRKESSVPNLKIYTVVKWGHTEGIEREKTSSQKFTVIALDFWRNKLLLVFQIWGQNTIGGQFLEYCHLIWNCPWFLKRFLIFQIWGYYLQNLFLDAI